MSDGPARRVDRSGRSQYVRKSTQAEISRRNVWIAKLYRRGHTISEISDGLTIATETVRLTLHDLGLYHGRRYKGKGPVTEHCPWRDEDVPMAERERVIPPGAEESRWRQSRVVGMAQMLNDEYRESNFSNVLANQASDAEDGGDKAWLMEALATFNAAIEKLERARRVLTDDNYREACQNTLEGVEQMRHRQPQIALTRLSIVR